MSGGENGARFVIDGREPKEVMFPESVEQAAGMLYTAAEHQRAVSPVGIGAFLHIGGLPRRYDLALCLQRMNRVLDYQPTDMTVSVEAGIPLAGLQQVLEEQNQWLPIDPPWPERVTVGGLIAMNLSGPSRLSQGTIRDFLIGIKVIRADGTVIKSGGRVVKNVAGYDLAKLYCGSFGTLGVIAEATFKIRPRPEAQTVVSFLFPSAEQAMAVVLGVLGTELQPTLLELANSAVGGGQRSDRSSYQLFIGFSGSAEEITYQHGRLQEIAGTSAEKHPTLSEAIRDFPVSGEAALRCKVNLLPSQIAAFCKAVEEEALVRDLSVEIVAHAGNGILYCRLPQRDNPPQEKLLSFVDWIRILAKKLGGSVVIEAIDPALKDRVDVWGHVGSSFPLMKRLKETLDPQGMLNPGRFVGGI
ncbi:MAG: FAD-binding oxidoreductase [Deltaproteobacteria bacterium]|nr:FAD-binding oxidoreductase [Deltaproteobacteria bacterium]